MTSTYRLRPPPGSSEDNPIETEGGRKIWRHPNGQGCVIEYDYWGTPSKLFVADAKYRGEGRWGGDGGLVTGREIRVTDALFNGKDSRGTLEILSESPNSEDPRAPAHPDADAAKQPLPYSRSDKWIQSTYPDLRNDKTAYRATNDIISSESMAEIAKHCRSVNPPDVGPCDQPNLYQVIMLYLESDNIDKLDPTVSSYSKNALGYRNSRWGRFGLCENGGFYQMIAATTEYSSMYHWSVTWEGRCTWSEDSFNSMTSKSDQYGAVPVSELYD